MSNTTGKDECPYRHKCTDRGVKCPTCEHEPNRSYYQPVNPCYVPVYPIYPMNPWTVTWSDATVDHSTGTFYTPIKEG